MVRVLSSRAERVSCWHPWLPADYDDHIFGPWRDAPGCDTASMQQRCCHWCGHVEQVRRAVDAEDVALASALLLISVGVALVWVMFGWA